MNEYGEKVLLNIMYQVVPACACINSRIFFSNQCKKGRQSAAALPYYNITVSKRLYTTHTKRKFTEVQSKISEASDFIDFLRGHLSLLSHQKTNFVCSNRLKNLKKSF